MRTPRVLIVGAGIGGLVAAIDLASRGVEVMVLERAQTPGGKMRTVQIDGADLDGGPTVLTMRWVFEEIFADAGSSLADKLKLTRAVVAARHAWNLEQRLDLFADRERTVDAIGRFAGAADARGYRAFSERARRLYEALEHSFIRSSRPNPLTLTRRCGLKGLGALLETTPFVTLWRSLGGHFRDPRLRQLFARYSTYVGSSPFQAPATLMLVAHVEQAGVWYVVGGMRRLPQALAELAQGHGAEFCYATEVHQVLLRSGRANGVQLANGLQIQADAVVINADTAALRSGAFGRDAIGAVPRVAGDRRSLSALTWLMSARTDGFPLLHHNVFFSGDYGGEFRDLRQHGRLPSTPTVYVCAQDRGDSPGHPRGIPERLLCLVNAPPLGDREQPDDEAIASCERAAFGFLKHCGLTIERKATSTVVTGPREFARLFPATGGALYGTATHGWQASFKRPGSRSRIPGLYLAGGSVHPGPGVPMAALSGRLAARCVLEDLSHGGPIDLRAPGLLTLRPRGPGSQP